MKSSMNRIISEAIGEVIFESKDEENILAILGLDDTSSSVKECEDGFEITLHDKRLANPFAMMAIARKANSLGYESKMGFMSRNGEITFKLIR